MGRVGEQHKIIISGAETILCPHYQHKFPLVAGISRQTIDRYAPILLLHQREAKSCGAD